MAAQLLKGKSPAQVLQIVPLLFSVCGRAQGAAAGAALQAAQHGTAEPTRAELDRIACEAIQEHLWRLLLDWPRLLGLLQQEADFRRWYAMLSRISKGEAEMEIFLHEFEISSLGLTAEECRMLDNDQILDDWINSVHSPLAKLLSTLASVAAGERGMQSNRLLPAWSALEAQQACAGNWDAAFAVRPQWQGTAAETGVWSYYADHRLMSAAWQRFRSKVLMRVLARVIDIIALAQGEYAARLDVSSPAPDQGVAAVRTARGLLLHRVRLEQDRVADYTIVAPTEWNFHPEGAFAQDMSGQKAQDVEGLKQSAMIAALSLDPCVAYEIEITPGDGQYA